MTTNGEKVICDCKRSGKVITHRTDCPVVSFLFEPVPLETVQTGGFISDPAERMARRAQERIDKLEARVAALERTVSGSES